MAGRLDTWHMTATQQRASDALGEHVMAWVISQWFKRITYREMSAALRAVGVEVQPETLRRWVHEYWYGK